ncbi:MAG: bifunctional YncE family protein/alkaline phosphatase family protein [Isosphaeraceae bacterium]
MKFVILAIRTPLLIFPALVLGLGLAAFAADPETPRQEITWPGMNRAGTVLLPNGWSLKPAGKQVPLGDLPLTIAECPTAPVLAVLHAGYGEHEVITLDAKNGKTIGRVALHQTYGGLVWSRDGRRLFVGGGFDDQLYRFDHADGLLSNKVVMTYPPLMPGPTRVRVPSGLAISADGQWLWVANAWGHTLARFNLETLRLDAEIETGPDSYPYALAWDEKANRLYASLWGVAKVAVVDPEQKRVLDHWKSEDHPNELLLARDGKVLYCANANRNTVSAFDTKAGKAVETIGTAIDPRAPSGSTPNSLALSPDENVLFVANANTNDLAAVNVKELGASSPLGFIPVGWYPTSVRVSKTGKTLYVANGKGHSSKANRDGPLPGFVGGTNKLRDYIAGLFQGTMSLIPMPGPEEMSAYSKTVYECSPLKKGDPTATTGPKPPSGNPIPAKVGDPSPIKYCIYVVKENRTYDQVFGDMPEGNGEPALCLFPEEVSPNHHALAREFVLLDNFYVESEVSADGHEWTMGAYATDFVERTWPITYRGEGKAPFPAEGSETVFSIARPTAGYLWDRAAEKKVSYRSYGEFIHNGKTLTDPGHTVVETLKGHFDPKFRGFDMNYPDQKRADRFLEELKGFEETGEMPRLIILRLPNDHTAGTSPGKPTTTAYVADNDLALGRIVEALSKSRFWKELAIFVVEDDAQNGSDHVDAHRTVALAISPYIKRKSVDSTMYSTSSMLRTIELILGLDPMSQFDAAARPMWASFTAEPDLTPYIHLPARVDLDAKNLATAWGAAESLKLNLEVEDMADDLVFNEIIWKSVKGADSPMPPPVRAAFVLPKGKVHGDGNDDD